MYCFFYRKRKVRNKTADSVILLREENQNECNDLDKILVLIGLTSLDPEMQGT